jgi:hypothetical protein
MQEGREESGGWKQEVRKGKTRGRESVHNTGERS